MKQSKSSTGGVISAYDLKKANVKCLYYILFAIMAIIAIVCIMPPIWVMLSSLQDPKLFYSVNPPLIPKDLHWEKICSVWDKLEFGRLYLNSLWLTIGSVVCAVVFNAMLAFVISRLKPAGSKFVFLLVLWTMMLPNTTSMIPMYQNIVHFPLFGFSLMNSFIGLWLMNGTNAFNVVVFKSFFDGIPGELVEAAQIDGATNMKIFFRIMVPMSIPVISTITIFTIIGSWSDFFWPYLILKNADIQTVIVGVFNANGLADDEKLIALTLVMLPPIIFFIFMQKYIMKGLSFNGIKG